MAQGWNQGQGQPAWPQQQHPHPQQHGYYPPPQYPPVQVNVTQNAYGPRSAVTRRGLGPFWTAVHLCMTCLTGGLWGVVWWWHYRSRRSVTTFR